MPQQPISQSELDGRKLAFDVAKNYIDPKQRDAFAKEVEFYTSVPIKEDKTPELIALETVRSQTAQLRELRKEQESVLANEQKIVEAVELTKETIEKMYPKHLIDINDVSYKQERIKKD